MECPGCRHENPVGARFCNGCGQPLAAAACPKCGRANPEGSRYCNECACDLTSTVDTSEGPFSAPRSYTPPHLAQKILISKTALEGERKLVTVLFCDIANSTALAELLGPEAMHALLNRFFELALAEVHRYEGTINQFLGDGFMALFGAPIAHEDHARRAVLSALGIQRAVRERLAERPAEEGRLVVRMGLNTGPVVVGKIGDNLRMDYTAVGDTTNLAARLQQAAEAGTILISGTTSRAVELYVSLEAVPPLLLKGKPTAVTAFKVLRAIRRTRWSAAGGRVLSPFVGRDRDLAALLDLLAEIRSGRGQVAGIVGEPGVGKSRLLYEFQQAIADTPDAYLEGRCLSYGTTVPYLPLQDVLRNACGIVDADPPTLVAEKLRDGLTYLDMSEDGFPYLSLLLGLEEGTRALAKVSPKSVKQRIFDTLRQMTVRAAERRPLVIALEDLHWIDRTSEEYLTALVDAMAGVPILIVTTYRPGYRPPWLDRSYVTQLPLRPLAAEQSLHVVRSVLERAETTYHVVAGILIKAEGNPFFLEELTRTVLEHGAVPSAATIPATIQDVLMARIDRLPEHLKRLLQIAAVIGREFSSQLLAAVSRDGDELSARLAELARAEFLYERSGPAGVVYVFKHVLTQEVAYDGLLTARRKELHAAVGRALESLYGNRLEEFYDQLAHHFSESPLDREAVEYLIRSADKATRRYAHAEAVASLDRALRHVDNLPAGERDVRFVELARRRGESLFLLGRFAECVEDFERNRDRIAAVDDDAVLGPYFVNLAQTYSFLGARERAREYALRALHHVRRVGDSVMIGRTHAMLGLECMFAGRHEEAVHHGEQSVLALKGVDDALALDMGYYVLALARLSVGDFDNALESAYQLRKLGEAVDDRRMQSHADTTMAWIHGLRGEGGEAVAIAERAVRAAPDAFEGSWAKAMLGYGYLVQDQPARAGPLLLTAYEEAVRFRSKQVRAWVATHLADALLRQGDRETARDLAAAARIVAHDAQNPWGVGLATEVLGHIGVAEGDLEDARALYTEALGIFASTGAWFYAARADLDLARVAKASGNTEEAARHASEARDRFRSLNVPRYVEEVERLTAMAVRPAVQ